MPRAITRQVALLLALLLALLTLGCADEPDTDLRVTVIDVGQGDATLLSQAGKHMLIDTGSAFAADALLRELEANGVKKLDLLVLTHPHEDHVGNARRLLMELEVETLVVPTDIAVDFSYDLVLATARERCDAVRVVGAGDELALGDATCTVLYAQVNAEDWNDASIVLRVEYGETALLFMGDAGAKIEAELLRKMPQLLECDFLRVGHHGSEDATTGAFLSAATPTLAAVGCGEQNTYGFPHAAVLENLDVMGVRVWRTDLDGTVVFISDGENIRFHSKSKGA